MNCKVVMWLPSSFTFLLKFLTRNEGIYGVNFFSLQPVELCQLQSDETAFNLSFFICYWLIAVTYRTLTYRTLTYRTLTYSTLTYRTLTYRTLTYRTLTCRSTLYLGAMSVGLLSSLMLVLHKQSMNCGY